MRLIAIFFLAGTLLIQLFPVLPSLLVVIAVGVSVLLCSVVLSTVILQKNSPKVKLFFTVVPAFFSGLLLAIFIAQNQIQNRLPAEWQGKDIIVSGKVDDIPEERGDGIRFRFKISDAYSASQPNKTIKLNGIVRLGWFQNKQAIHADETWQLRVRLKRPSGFLNPGGFDYEKWLFTERIIATGYIRKSKTEENKRLVASPWWSLNRLREDIHNTIQNKVEDKSSAAVLSALVVAVRTKLDDKQWKQLQLTGTSHLVAISGLHIAVVAGFAFFPIMLIWGLFPRLNEKVPLRVAGGIAGVVFATVYAMLAGFTLPTQRALLMVIIALFGLVSRKNYSSSQILASALIAVLILDPLAGMTISFWLSFLAVALILIFLKRQLVNPRYSMIKLQLVLSLGMLPLTLFFFGSASLTSPLANLVAIPWVSLIVVPISLIALFFMPISSFISESLFGVAALAINWLFKALDIISDSFLADITSPEIPGLYLLIAFVGLLFLLLPKGFPAKWLGLLAILPVFLFTVEKPKQGEFTYTLLDVGQGMASVLQTKNHSLIYDTGTRLSESFDIGKLVVLPYLKAKGIKRVDRMIISHEDIDHRGGAQTIIEGIPVDKVISSDTGLLPGRVITACVTGLHWQWDGVSFEMLSPSKSLLEDAQQNDNNISCVLRISNAHHSLLLTGDIQRQTEFILLDNAKQTLKSDVMSVPHHGSKTSSTQRFIEVVSPQLALIPAGYRNRFGHPKFEILERYRALGIELMDTVSAGAIMVDFPADSKSITRSSYRELNRGFWSR